MSVLVRGMDMPEKEYTDVRIFRDGTDVITTGEKPYSSDLRQYRKEEEHETN